MLFRKRIQRAFDHAFRKKDKSESKESDNTLASEMEKGDLTAMIIAALLVLVPAALVALLFIAGIAWLIML